ncbi:cadmium resistance transporter [Calothrix sp. NIES-4101]|nr:cadmium resistance transporter [Calothrix sp. NIES-4101]
MNWLTETLVIGVSAAIATTFDDNIYLTAFFGKVNRHFHVKHIVIGEFIGFTALILASLPGFFGGLMIPQAWIGLLGFLPISIGTYNFLNREEEAELAQAVSFESPVHQPLRPHKKPKSFWATIRDPKTYRVSAVTIANGGNNIGIYVPLFASSNLPSLAVIVSVCYSAIGVWCLLSYCMTRNPLMAPLMARYGRKFFPLILIWLGFSILMKSESYRLLPGFGV